MIEHIDLDMSDAYSAKFRLDTLKGKINEIIDAVNRKEKFDKIKIDELTKEMELAEKFKERI